MNFSRRDFLKDTATALALLAFDPLRPAWASGKPVGNELWLLCDTPKMVPNNLAGVMVTNPGSIKGLDIASGQSFKIDIPFFGHTAVQNPARPHEVVTFEKWGRRGALLDVRARSLVAAVEAEEGQLFFGHAAFLAGEFNLVTSEDNYARSKGRLTVRDSSTLKPVGVLSSYGVRPHDCKSLDDGKTIVTVNSGGHGDASNIAWIEAASGKLLHKVALDYERGLNFSHMDMAPDGWICAVGLLPSAQQKGNGRIALISPSGRVIQPKIPPDIAARMNNEVLSVTFFGKSGLAAATAPASDMVIVLHCKTQEFVDAIDVQRPSAVLGDLSGPDSESSIIVTNAIRKKLMKIVFSAPGAAPTVNAEKTHFGGNGSHMTRIYV